MNKKVKNLITSKVLASVIMVTTLSQACLPYIAYSRQLRTVRKTVSAKKVTPKVAKRGIAAKKSKPVSKVQIKPANKLKIKSVSKAPSKPVRKIASKPVSKVVSKPVSKAPIKPVSKVASKPVSKAPIKPVSKVASKPVVKAPIKPVSKVASKPVVKAPIKPVSKVASKPVIKAPIKPVSKVASKPVVKVQSKPAVNVASKPASIISDYNQKINFTAKNLKDINGKPVSLSDYKGKKVFLTYWLDICPQDMAHLDRLNKLYRAAKGKEDVEFLFVTYTGYKPEERKDFVDFPILLDNLIDPTGYWAVEVAKKLQVQGMGVPDSYLIDERGNILKHSIGFMNLMEMKNFTGITTKVEGEVKDSYNRGTNFTVKDSNGKTVKLDDYSGKKVFLTYWYPWKENIERHLENVNKIYNSLGNRKDINILTVTWDGFDYANNYAKDKGYNFPILKDNYLKNVNLLSDFRKYLRTNYLIASKFGIKNIDNPSSYLLDENGYIIKSSDKEMSVNELKDFMGVKDLKIVEDNKGKDTYNKFNNFTATTLEGKEVSLKDFKGKKVFLAYFYPYHEDQEDHLQYINELYNRLNRKDIEILTITSWQHAGEKEHLRDEDGLDFPILVDIPGWYPHQQHKYTSIIGGKYQVNHTLYPSSYLIDENGNIIKEHHNSYQGKLDLKGIMKFIGISEKDLKDKSTYKSKKKIKFHLPGDTNGNNILDERDLMNIKHVADKRKTDMEYYESYRLLIDDMDMNADGVVDDTDVELVEKALGKCKGCKK